MSGRILIAGPGRSGTTLLVKLLDGLGFDTGVDQLTFDEVSRAGLEYDLEEPGAPEVVKAPKVSSQLRQMIECRRILPEEIDWLVIPLRSLEDAAASRVAVAFERRNLNAPGGLVGTKRPGRQQAQLGEDLYALLETAALYELAVITLAYPRFALDTMYAFRRLEPMLRSCSSTEFDAVWRTVVDPDLVRSQPIAMPRFIELKATRLQLLFLYHYKVKPLMRRLLPGSTNR